MSTPTVTFYEITSQGTTYVNDLTRFGVAGGPTGILRGTGGSPALSFGDVDGGQWSLAKPIVLQVDGGQVQSLKFRLYDSESNLENFYDGVGGDWDFRIKLFADYVDPATLTAIAIGAWPQIPVGVSVLGYDIDAGVPNPGNNDTDSLLVAHHTVTSRFLTNFYIYLAAKPEGNAVAGLHTGWSFRLNSKNAGA